MPLYPTFTDTLRMDFPSLRSQDSSSELFSRSVAGQRLICTDSSWPKPPSLADLCHVLLAGLSIHLLFPCHLTLMLCTGGACKTTIPCSFSHCASHCYVTWEDDTFPTLLSGDLEFLKQRQVAEVMLKGVSMNFKLSLLQWAP